MPVNARYHLKWLIPLLLLACATGGFMLLKSSKPSPQAEAADIKRWSVQAEAVQQGAFQPQVVLYGKVESPSETVLTAASTAYIQQVHVNEGETVAAGDLLIQLNPKDAELVLQQREADLTGSKAQITAAKVEHNANQSALKLEQQLYNLAQKTVSRYQNLKQRKAISEDQLDSALKSLRAQGLSLNSRKQAIAAYPARLAQLEAQKTKAQALRDSAALDLERTRITAPFSGRISSLSAATGDRVTPGSQLITLYNPTTLQIRSQLPDRLLPVIRQSLQKHTAIDATAALDGQSLSLQLIQLGGAVSTGQSGIDGLFQFISGNPFTTPGRSLEITLTLPPQEGLFSIAPSALYGNNRVYRIHERQLEAVSVTQIGSLRLPDGQTRLLIQANDLNNGDPITTTQLPNALSGLPVTILE